VIIISVISNIDIFLLRTDIVAQYTDSLGKADVDATLHIGLSCSNLTSCFAHALAAKQKVSRTCLGRRKNSSFLDPKADRWNMEFRRRIPFFIVVKWTRF